MRIEQIPFEPGDVVRDRKTSTDYIIQSAYGITAGATTAAIAGGIMVYATQLSDDKLISWAANSVDDLLISHAVVRKAQGDSAHHVRELFSDTINNLLNNRKELIDSIHLPENSHLRDLFLVGMDSTNITDRFTELAETLVDLTGKLPSKEAISSILADTADSHHFPPEVIDYLASSMASAARQKKGAESFMLMDKSDLSRLMLNQDGELGGSLFILDKLRRQINSTNQETRNSLANEFLNSKSGMYDVHMPTAYKGIIALTPEDRVVALAKKTIEDQGGSFTPQLEQYFSSNARKIGGDVSRGTFEHPGTQILSNALASDAGLAQYFDQFRRTKRFSFLNQYNKPTAKGFAKKIISPPRRNILGEIHGLNEKTTKIAISTEAFFNEVIGNAKLTVQGMKGTLANQAIRDKLSSLASPTGYMVLHKKTLREIETMMAKNDADGIRLDHVLEESEALLRQVHETVGLNEDIKTHLFSPTWHGAVSPKDPYVVLTNHNQINTQTTLQNLIRDLRADEKGLSADQRRVYFAKSQKTDTMVASHSLEDLITGSVDHDFKHISYNDSNLTLNSGLSEVSDNMSQGLFVGSTPLLDTSKLAAIKEVVRGNAETVHIAKSDRIEKAQPRALVESFLKGFDSENLAIAQVKTKDGQSFFKLMGTAVEASLTQQMDLLAHAQGGQGILLDIETRKHLGTGKDYIKEIAYGDRHSQKSWTNVTETQLPGILEELANDLSAKSGSQYTVRSVGTQSNYDLPMLIMKAKAAKERNPELADRMDRVINIFHDVETNRLFDVQLAYQLHGEDLGNLSQEYMTLKHLGRQETHRALGDIKDAWEILDRLGPHNLDSIDFTSGMAVEEMGLMYMDTNTLSPYAGRIRQLMSLRTQFSAEKGANRAVATFREYDSVRQLDGSFKLVPLSHVFEQEAESASMLGASLHKYSTLVDPKTFNHASIDTAGGSISLAQHHQNLIHDREGRGIRGLNPNTSTYFDTVDQFLPNEHGPFAAYNLLRNNEARQLMPLVHQEHVRLQNEYMMENNLQTITGIHLTRTADLADKAADSVLATYESKTARMLDRETHAVYLKELLVDGLQNSTRFTSQDRMAELINSPTGQYLLKAARTTLNERNQTTDFFYNIAYGNLIRQASLTNSIYRQSMTPRLGLTMGGNSTSFQFIGEGSIPSLKHQMSNLAAQDLFTLDENKPAAKYLAGLGYDIGELKNQAEEYKTKRFTPDNLEAWKKAQHELPLFKGDPSIDKLISAHGDLQNSDLMHNAVISSILKKTENAKTPELQAFGQKLVDDLRAIDRSKGLGAETEKVFFHHAQKERMMADLLTDTYRDVSIEGASLHQLAEARIQTMRQYNDLMSLDKEYNNINFSKQLIAEATEKTKETISQNLDDPEFNRSAVFSNTLDSLIDQHKSGLAAQPQIQGARVGIQDAMQTAINKAEATVAQSQGGSVEVKLQQKLGLMEGLNGIAAGTKMFSKVSAPLLALGGLVGLMAAKNPNMDPFSQGPHSEYNNMSGDEHLVAKASEIPGHADRPTTWFGNLEPFRLDISFDGFVQHKDEVDRLQRDVFNILSSQVEVRKRTGDVQDRRNKQHRMMAIDTIRGI